MIRYFHETASYLSRGAIVCVSPLASIKELVGAKGKLVNIDLRQDLYTVEFLFECQGSSTFQFHYNEIEQMGPDARRSRVLPTAELAVPLAPLPVPPIAPAPTTPSAAPCAASAILPDGAWEL